MSKYLLPLLLVTIIGILACQPDENYVTNGVSLRLSRDTLRFDTVFTSVGSATRSFKVYNDEDDPVLISRLGLADESSFFRLNVDGVSGQEVRDVRIAGGDSIYVFTEVTIDPDKPLSVSPFIVEDQVHIEVNEAVTTLQLEAFGQNANYFPQPQGQGVDSIIPCPFGSIVWNDPKPYVIYGRVIFADCEWVLPAGTDVYVHGGLRRDASRNYYNDGLIVIYTTASIKAEGTAAEPVTFQSDRLEDVFDDVPGQWSGIYLTPGSRGNRMQYTTIQHSDFGVRVDSAASLRLDNSTIAHTTAQGLLGIHAQVRADNCLIHSNGSYAVQFTYGGDYTMNYCTVASYGNQAEALYLGNNICADPNCELPRRTFPLEAAFTNCVFTGSDGDELLLSDVSRFDIGQEETFDYSLDHCAVTVDDLLDAEAYPNFFDQCKSCLNVGRRDTLFVDFNEADYYLDTLSNLEMKALPIGISIDRDGLARDPSQPDIGCYEYQY